MTCYPKLRYPRSTRQTSKTRGPPYRGYGIPAFQIMRAANFQSFISTTCQFSKTRDPPHRGYGRRVQNQAAFNPNRDRRLTRTNSFLRPMLEEAQEDEVLTLGSESESESSDFSNEDEESYRVLDNWSLPSGAGSYYLNNEPYNPYLDSESTDSGYDLESESAQEQAYEDDWSYPSGPLNHFLLGDDVYGISAYEAEADDSYSEDSVATTESDAFMRECQDFYHTPEYCRPVNQMDFDSANIDSTVCSDFPEGSTTYKPDEYVTESSYFDGIMRRVRRDHSVFNRYSRKMSATLRQVITEIPDGQLFLAKTGSDTRLMQEVVDIFTVIGQIAVSESIDGILMAIGGYVLRFITRGETTSQRIIAFFAKRICASAGVTSSRYTPDPLNEERIPVDLDGNIVPENQGRITDWLKEIKGYCTLSKKTTSEYMNAPLFKAFRSWIAVLCCAGMIEDKSWLTIPGLESLEKKWSDKESSITVFDTTEAVLSALEYSIDVATIAEDGELIDLIVPRNLMLEHHNLMSLEEYARIGSVDKMGMSLQDFTDRLRKHADNLVNAIRTCTSPIQTNIFTNAYRDTIAAAVRLKVKLHANDNVMQPYGLLFHSTPGAGKSYAQRASAGICLTIADGTPLVANDVRIATLNRSQYDDTVTNETRIIFIDDAAAEKPDKAGSNVVPASTHIIEKINNTQKSAIKSESKEKGTVNPDIAAVILSTNVWSLHLAQTTSTPEAIGRRIRIGADLFVIKEYQDEQGAFDGVKYELDVERAEMTGKPIPDPNLYRVWRYGTTEGGKLIRVYMGEKGPDGEYPKLNSREFYSYLALSMKRHFNAQEKYLKKLKISMWLCPHGTSNTCCDICRKLTWEQSKALKPPPEMAKNQSVAMALSMAELVNWERVLSHVPVPWQLLPLAGRLLLFATRSTACTIYTRATVALSIWTMIPTGLFQSFVYWYYGHTNLVDWRLVIPFMTWCVFCVWSLMAYLKMRMRVALSGAVTGNVEEANAYYNCLAAKKFGVVCTCLAMFSFGYKQFRKLRIESQSLSPTTSEDIKARATAPDQWARTNIPVEDLPVKAKINSMTLSQVMSVVGMNQYVMHVKESRIGMGLLVSTGRFWVPKHLWECVPDKEYAFNFKRIKNGTEFPATVVQVNALAPDLVELVLSSSHTVKDIKGLILSRGKMETAAILLTPKAVDTVRSFRWKWIATARGAVDTYEGSEHVYNSPTKMGDCMSVAISKNKPHFILGFHLAGVPRSNTGICGSVDMAPVLAREAQNQGYDISTRYPQASTLERVPTEVFGKTLYEAGPAHPSAVVNYSATAEILRYDLPEIREIVPKPDRMIGVDFPQVQNYGGRGMKARSSPSCVEVTPLSTSLTLLGRPNKWGPPPRLTDSAYAKGYANISHPMWPIPSHYLEWAKRDYLAPLLDPGLLALYSNAGECPPGPLTEEQVLNGIKDRKFIKTINVNTSPGMGLEGKKVDHLDLDEEDGAHSYSFKPHVREVFQQDDNKIRAGIQSCPISKTALKDEPTLIGKKKNRIFVILPMVFLSLGRKYLQFIVDFLLSFPLLSEMAVGVQCINEEWGELYHHLANSNSKDTQIWKMQTMEGDYSAYDQRITTQLLDMVGLIFCVLGAGFNYDAESTRAIATWFADVARPLIMFNGVLLRFMGYNTSGNTVTIIINNLVNSLLFRSFYVDYHLRGLGVRLEEIPPFRNHVRAIFVGDDSLVTTNLPWFNMVNYKMFLYEFGMPYTDASKNDQVSEFLNLDDATLCKRGFSHENGVVLSPIELDSIYKSLHCWMNRGKVSVDSVLPQNIDAALMELARHPKEVYMREHAIISRAVDLAGYSHMCRYVNWSFEEMRALALAYFPPEDEEEYFMDNPEA